MAGLVLAMALAAAAPSSSAAATTPPDHVHQYHDVMISPNGAQVAAVESDDPFASEADPHGQVVVRDRDSGKIVAQYDPCQACFYAGLRWSPDGKALVFVASDRKARSASLIVAREGKAGSVLEFAGLLADPLWSPDGQTLAVLA
ncbi:MAG: PD40 domain-containing protein, partial [Proteobacteria bacterium]|nr:PD40 domain-containing protein [Pseudomonadota bacterium]